MLPPCVRSVMEWMGGATGARPRARRVLRHESRAVTALEYGLIASVIAVLIVGSVRALGTSTSATFDKIATTL